jgi:DNA-binding LytR/AlgR family response regulator
MVVDDEQDAISVLSKLIEDTGRVKQVIALQDSRKVECTIQKEKPDVLFLDIEISEVNGLEILQNIREYDLDLNVVIVSAYKKYIPDAIKLNVFSYLLKPVDREELSVIINKLSDKLISAVPETFDEKIKLPVKDGFVYVTMDDIFFLEAEGNYTWIYTRDEKKYLSSYNMGRLAKKCNNLNLQRINRQQYLNKKYIMRVNRKSRNCTVQINGSERLFEVSKAFLTAFNKEC